MPKIPSENQLKALASDVNSKAKITVTSSDPGEGSVLNANNFVAVYGEDSKVKSADIADNAITTAKLADKAVTSDKMDWTTILNKLYPVGTIYQSINSTNPSSFLGGSWTQISYVTFRVSDKTNFAFNVSGGVAPLTDRANIIAYPFENNTNTRFQIWDNTQRIYMWRRTA